MCRYHEAIDILYSSNVFVFLQNSIWRDLHTSIPAQSFALIRSIHLHWEFIARVYARRRRPSRLSFSEQEILGLSETCSEEIFQKMPRLQNISIFIYGPMEQELWLQQILDNMVSGAREANIPFFMIRTPWRLGSWWPNDEESTRVLQSPDTRFRLWICRAPLKPGGHYNSVVDGDCGAPYWRVGSMFEPDRKDADGFIITDYAVYTPFYLERWRETVLRSARLGRRKFARLLR
jgi:hypothetical protein